LKDGPARMIQEDTLQGECVAFTGLLRDADHRRALAVVAAAGGLPSPQLTRSTTLLVVGMRGWRGMGDGRANGTLRQAEHWQLRGFGPRIIPERAFWARVEGQRETAAASQVCTMEQAAGLTGLSLEQLRRCVQLGLVRSEEGGLCFEDLLAARAMVRSLRQGVTLEEVAGKWADLSRLLPEGPTEQALHRLVHDPIGGLALLFAEGVLVTEFGQLLLNFPATAQAAPNDLSAPGAAETSPVLRADELLERGSLVEAEALLRRALSRHPQQQEVLVALGKLCLERERYAEAESIFRQLLAASPEQSEALFCLALCCEELQKRQEAVGLWRAFLRLAPAGERAIVARAHLLRPAFPAAGTVTTD
jgi:hypothetical protein